MTAALRGWMAALGLTLVAPGAEPGMGDPPCHGAKECEATAVGVLEAAARLAEASQADEAWRLVEAAQPLVQTRSTGFAFDWFLAAGYLHQAHGDHARAYGFYRAAIDLRPADPQALLARVTALEASAIPDGFGGFFVADAVLWGFIGGGDPPSELGSRLANPRPQDRHRRNLLEVLTRLYREVVALDPALVEARLRLGRVRSERGDAKGARENLRAAAEESGDPFVAAVARLYLARLAPSHEEAAALFRSALDVDPSLQPAWLGLSHALDAGGDRTGARAALENGLIRRGPRPLNAWVEYHLGRGRAFPAALARLRARRS